MVSAPLDLTVAVPDPSAVRGKSAQSPSPSRSSGASSLNTTDSDPGRSRAPSPSATSTSTSSGRLSRQQQVDTSAGYLSPSPPASLPRTGSKKPSPPSSGFPTPQRSFAEFFSTAASGRYAGDWGGHDNYFVQRDASTSKEKTSRSGKLKGSNLEGKSRLKTGKVDDRPGRSVEGSEKRKRQTRQAQGLSQSPAVAADDEQGDGCEDEDDPKPAVDKLGERQGGWSADVVLPRLREGVALTLPPARSCSLV
jgi:hypothetical protein